MTTPIKIACSALCLMLVTSGCGISDETTDTVTSQQPISELPADYEIPLQEEKELYSATVSQESDSAFTDLYTQQQIADIPWPETQQYTPLSVAEIERIFTEARMQDPTVNTAMVLPPQSVWDSMSSAEKVLYLVNKARSDRGIKPFEGLDPTISSVAQTYAQFLADNPERYAQNPHEADGRTPFERMADAGVSVGENADFFEYGENIASLAIGTSESTYPAVYEHEAKAVYGWLYEDLAGQAIAYGHRKFLLANQLVENSGKTYAEGLIGIGTALRQYTDEQGYNWSEKIIVMDGFDPKSNWDNNLASAQDVNLYR